jgi:beta-lactamase regulating signal transducer with metallopeptidase domain
VTAFNAFALEYAVQAALMLMAGALADRFLRSRPAALRHAVWTLALAAALSLPLLSVVLAGHRIELRVPGLPRAAPFVETGAPAGQPVERDRLPVFLVPMGESSPASRVLLGVWLAGSMILLARIAVGRIGLRRILQGTRPAAVDGGLLEEVAGAAGCRRRVRLLVHGSMPTPVAFGILRPVVILPEGWDAWPRSRTRAVLLHELGHVARFDALAQLLAQLVRALHWFDPFAWHAAHRLGVERERACDDLVLSAGVGSREYAGHIVAAAREMSARPRLAGGLPIAPCTELESRLRAILDPAVPRERTSWLQRLRLLSAAASGAVVLTCLAIVPAATAVDLDDPLSEVVPGVAARQVLADTDLRNDAERVAFRRLREAAAHVKQWKGDLVRERAEWALSQIEDGEVVPPLLRALEDPDWRVQGYAAWALATAGDRRAVGPVTELLDHPVWRVRSQAVFSLLSLDAGLPDAQLPVLAADPAWQVRIGVVEYLSHRGGPEAVAGLRALADDPHGGTRMTAREALAELEAKTR